MQDTILEQLRLIEQKHHVSIILAVESGSRAWGFPSADSDYDVRFIYARPLERYLSIEPGRDVIEIPVDPVLDINGWDIRKALQLLRKSNNSVLEWLSSPIRYRCNAELLKVLESMVPRGFQQHTSARHYLSMAKTNMGKIDGPIVRMKAYLYAVRPLLCCRWVLEENTQPPMIFRELLQEYLGNTNAGDVISDLIRQKQSQQEADKVAAIPVLNEFIKDEFCRLNAMLPEDRALPDSTAFDQAFRLIIEKASR